MEKTLVEEEAVELAEATINDGSAAGVILPDDVAPAPEGAVAEVGGKSCKWCGSTTHSHRSHKDCPHNKSNSSESS